LAALVSFCVSNFFLPVSFWSTQWFNVFENMLSLQLRKGDALLFVEFISQNGALIFEEKCKLESTVAACQEQTGASVKEFI
jgi:hypothetical protein